ncbi:hypothetical protein QBC43DRAFT_301658 [Cladorrhinum sp. PSN259]|nr:hypothetical protein QBC43DRAFT_301658 [Cladorrhinum sp. PSN259]
MVNTGGARSPGSRQCIIFARTGLSIIDVAALAHVIAFLTKIQDPFAPHPSEGKRSHYCLALISIAVSMLVNIPGAVLPFLNRLCINSAINASAAIDLIPGILGIVAAIIIFINEDFIFLAESGRIPPLYPSMDQRKAFAAKPLVVGLFHILASIVLFSIRYISLKKNSLGEPPCSEMSTHQEVNEDGKKEIVQDEEFKDIKEDKKMDLQDDTKIEISEPGAIATDPACFSADPEKEGDCNLENRNSINLPCTLTATPDAPTPGFPRQTDMLRRITYITRIPLLLFAIVTFGYVVFYSGLLKDAFDGKSGIKQSFGLLVTLAAAVLNLTMVTVAFFRAKSIHLAAIYAAILDMFIGAVGVVTATVLFSFESLEQIDRVTGCLHYDESNNVSWVDPCGPFTVWKEADMWIDHWQLAWCWLMLGLSAANLLSCPISLISACCVRRTRTSSAGNEQPPKYSTFPVQTAPSTYDVERVARGPVEDGVVRAI